MTYDHWKTTPPDDGDEPPQEWHECGACDGSGVIAYRVTVYEHGCGFPHDDTDERACEKCNGAGGWLDDKTPDPPRPPWRHFTDEESEAWERVFR